MYVSFFAGTRLVLILIGKDTFSMDICHRLCSMLSGMKPSQTVEVSSSLNVYLA